MKTAYMFAYLIERVPEKKYRPYKSCYEMLAHFTSKHNISLDVINKMPMIWVKNKATKVVCLVTRFFVTDVLL